MGSHRTLEPPQVRTMPRPVGPDSPPRSGGGGDFDYSYSYSYSDTDKPRTPSRRGVRRRSPESRALAPAPSVLRIGLFRKLLALLFVTVAFDMIYVWDYFDRLDEAADGPEAGMHHLHESRRLGNLYKQVKINLSKVGGSESESSGPAGIVIPDEADFAKLSGKQKVEELEREVHWFREKYEHAMARLQENPYPNRELPYTPHPPNKGNDDEKPKPPPKRKKRKQELENEETYGVDEHIVKILHAASVEIDEELAGQLPTWDDVVSLYGDKPIVRGLETCERYRDTVQPRDRMLGPAGMFNTGTNLLFELMKTNCDIKEGRGSPTHFEPRENGMRWQPPWGKHNPPTTHRNINVARAWGMIRPKGKEKIDQNLFFPVVLIKDPYSWMGSQCRHKYTTFWGHDDQHCPNLIRWRITEEDVPSEVRVKYALKMNMYESLLDMWNQWYEEWEEQTFPHLTTRFEDLLFHGEEVTRQACDCVGGVFTNDFQYVEESAKPEKGVHKGANGLVKAMLQYGDPKKRLNGFTDRDRVYASRKADTDLMRKYGYAIPPLPTPLEPV
ncbi:hypothetical protein ACHAWF_002461 [Thalassiosira exigua]